MSVLIMRNERRDATRQTADVHQRTFPLTNISPRQIPGKLKFPAVALVYKADVDTQRMEIMSSMNKAKRMLFVRADSKIKPLKVKAYKLLILYYV